jgi:hypothetical protein
MTDTDMGTCNWRSPGKMDAHPAERGWRGQRICWDCHRWVKMDLPAAEHWLRVSREFLSNVDMYDATSFLPRMFGDKYGNKGTEVIEAVAEFRDNLVRLLDADNPAWPDHNAQVNA